ncbi:MAG TPA: glycosyltransferase family 39 protein [Kofleriaceae bacterium]|nr:glycosyltransferase family 39 protein [Kofleriaceae bacterium]
MCATAYRTAPRPGSLLSWPARWPPWLVIAVVAAVLRLPAFLRPLLDDDEAQYAAVGELVRAGGQLYGDGGVDFKPPGIYWTYAAVFDGFGRYAMWAIHLLALAVVIATAWILCAIATRIASRRAGVLAGVFYGVFTTVYYPKMLAANTEIFMMLALSGMALLVLRARDARLGPALGALAAGGALVAIASGYKQSAAINLAVIAAGVIATRAWLARLAAAGVGFAAALGAGALAVAATSSLAAMWHWCVTQVVGKYGAGAWHGSVGHNVAVGLLPFVASSLLVWLAGAARATRIRAAGAAERIVWVWFALSLASSFAGGHFFGHYFIQPLAPLAVLAALEVDRRLGATAGRALARGVAALTALPAVGFFAFNLVFEPITEAFGAPDPDFRGPVAWVRDHTGPSDRIFVWGNFSPIYVLADRLPASRFVGFLRGAERNKNVPPETGWDTGPEVWPALAEDFARHRPAVVIDTSTADYMSFGNYPIRRFPAVAALLRDYRVAAVIDRVTMYVPTEAR